MEIDKKRVGQRIRSIRQSKGMTMEEFGGLFDATKGNVSLWEKGSSIPSNERLPLIAKIGGITVNELLYGTVKEYLHSFFTQHPDESISDDQLGRVYELYVNRFGETYQSDEVIMEFLNSVIDNFETEADGINLRRTLAISTYINAIYLEFLINSFSNDGLDRAQTLALDKSLGTCKFNFELIVKPFKVSKDSKNAIKNGILDTLNSINDQYDNKLYFNEEIFDSFFEV